MAPAKKPVAPAAQAAAVAAPPSMLSLPGESPAPAKAVSAPQARGAAQPGTAAALGEIVSLLVQSPAHRHLFLVDLEWLVVPPVMLRQFPLFRQGPRPIAYASWAMVNEEVEKRLVSGQPRLANGGRAITSG